MHFLFLYIVLDQFLNASLRSSYQVQIKFKLICFSLVTKIIKVAL